MKVIELISQLLLEDMNAEVTIFTNDDSGDEERIAIDGIQPNRERHSAFEVPLLADTDIFRRA
jgi:hypothetical protein